MNVVEEEIVVQMSWADLAVAEFVERMEGLRPGCADAYPKLKVCRIATKKRITPSTGSRQACARSAQHREICGAAPTNAILTRT